MNKRLIKELVHSSGFNRFITIVIVINCILFGIETYYTSIFISYIQNLILIIYVIELILRWVGKESKKEYFSDGWNYFDIFVILVSCIPDIGPFSALRALRILRILRALHTITELQLISEVLIRSISSLFYTAIFFLIFMYIYAVIGVSLFKMENYVGSVYERLNHGNPDPYGTLGEAFFTLFRIITGEDWTDLRYHLLECSKYPDYIVTGYHASWTIVSAFVLVNLVVGAVLNNYEQIMRNNLFKNDEKPLSKDKKHRKYV
jgi:voltage-gated sodium channel